MERLEALAERVRHELDHFCYYAQPWVKPAGHVGGHPVYDVAIVGGGQNGMAICHGLRMNGITNTLVIEAGPPGKAGNFNQYDRMLALRTPKDLTGLDFGLASLTFRSYWEAAYPDREWASLEKVIRTEWCDYLEWYRETLDIPILYNHRLIRYERAGPELLRLVVAGPDGDELTFYARSSVLATGFQSEAIKRLPMDIVGDTPRHLWAHGADPIDFPGLAGKRVAILGHGAGSFDCAAMALEAGAAEARVYYRRKAMPRVNPFRRLELPGIMANFHELDEGTKWKIAWLAGNRDQPAPELAMKRAGRLPGFSVHPGNGWRRIDAVGDSLRIALFDGVLEADFAILAIGYDRRPLERPELVELADEIATWEDYSPPAGYESERLQRFPRQGPGYEFTVKRDAPDRLVSHIFNFSFGSALAHGPHVTSISGIQFSLPRVVGGIRCLLTKLDEAAYLEDFEMRPEPEPYIDAFPDMIGER